MCRAREQVAFARTVLPMRVATGQLMSAPTSTSVVAARRLAARAGLARQAVLERCDRPSTPMRAYLRVVGRRTGDGLTHRDLDVVMSAYARWAAAVGERRTARELLEEQEGCRDLKRHVRATYRVWWEWAGTRRAWWLAYHYESRLRRTLTASLSGHARITGPGAGGGQAPRERRPRVVQWGASSYDSGVIPPGTSSQLVWLTGDRHLLTAAEESLEVQAVEVTTDVPGLRHAWCELPVLSR